MNIISTLVFWFNIRPTHVVARRKAQEFTFEFILVGNHVPIYIFSMKGFIAKPKLIWASSVFEKEGRGQIEFTTPKYDAFEFSINPNFEVSVPEAKAADFINLLNYDVLRRYNLSVWEGLP